MNEVLELAIESLKRNFPNKSRSWIARALRRLPSVREYKPNVWVVSGDPRLGDRSSIYVVRFDPVNGRYYCSCFESSWGLRRRNEICTHIAAVMLYRRYKSLMEDVYVFTIHGQCIDYLLQIPSGYKHEIRIIKKERRASGEGLKDVTYILWAKEPFSFIARLICDNEVHEIEIKPLKVKKYLVEIISNE